MGLRDNKLFAVDMPEDAVCDCGADAEVQFVITTSKGEAKRLAKEAQKARALKSKSADVVCGDCIARLIVQKGLFVTEVLKHSPIKWERVTEDTTCLDCAKPLPYGSWAHWHADSGRGICGDCGVHRGWSDKALASLSVKLAELKADVVTVRKRYNIEVQGLYLLEEKRDLHKVAENFIIVESKLRAVMSKLESYFNSVATPQEKTILLSLEGQIHELQDLYREVQKELDNRLLLIDRAERSRKMLQKVFESADAETEAERERMAPLAMAEVSA